MEVSNNTSTAIHERPPIPPRPVQDELEGLLTAFMTDAAKPHRDKVVDLLRLMETAPTGRQLLMELRALAQGGSTPLIDLRAEGAKPLDEAGDETPVWRLPAEAVRQGAVQIGVPPETQHAPTAFWDLIGVRNALVRLGGTSEAPLDPVQLQAQFRAELKGGDDAGRNGGAGKQAEGGAQPLDPSLHRASITTIRAAGSRPASLAEGGHLPAAPGAAPAPPAGPVTPGAGTSPSTPTDPATSELTQFEPEPTQIASRQLRLVRWARSSLRWLRGLMRRGRPNRAAKQDPETTVPAAPRNGRSATVATLRPTVPGNPASPTAPTTPDTADPSADAAQQRGRNRSGHRRVPSDADALLRDIGK
jgi:hypothetical protein